jgi:hypothetical protein
MSNTFVIFIIGFFVGIFILFKVFKKKQKVN